MIGLLLQAAIVMRRLYGRRARRQLSPAEESRQQEAQQHKRAERCHRNDPWLPCGEDSQLAPGRRPCRHLLALGKTRLSEPEVIEVRQLREGLCRRAAAVNAGHRRRPVVAQPNAADKAFSQPDEQGVLVARRRSSLALEVGVGRVCGAGRASLDRPAQGLEHGRGGRRRHHPWAVLRRRHANDIAAWPDRRDEEADVR